MTQIFPNSNTPLWDENKVMILRLAYLEVLPLAHLLGEEGVMFDIGGNVGHWSAAAALVYGARVKELHIFEPLPIARNRILKLKEAGYFDNFSNPPNIHNFAMSNKCGTAEIHFDNAVSPFATLSGNTTRLPHKDVSLENSLEIKTETIDTFCADNKIEKINLCKVDVEGHELDVFHGASRMLSERRINGIAFEFGLNQIRMKHFFRDFSDFFEQYGYKMSLVRRGEGGFDLLPIEKYITRWENFDSNRIFLATPSK